MNASYGSLGQKDLVSVAQLGPGDVQEIYKTAAKLKAERKTHGPLLAQKKLAMLFEKESLRTRFTFDIGIQDMGGTAVFLDHRHARLGSRESIRDLAKNLERWVDGIVARTYRHKVVEELAAHCSIPVINGLTDFLHPCQGLTDFFTMTEHFGDVVGRKLTYIGDGNNTCHSLVHTASKLGAHITVCTPEGYEPNAKVVNSAMIAARESNSEVLLESDPKKAVANADCIYTDVWASMGQEDEIEERAAIFGDYQVDDALMDAAGKDCVFMHCLPAHRGAEVTPGVMDGERSIVFDNAENRLHVQKAVMLLLMGQEAPVGVTA